METDSLLDASPSNGSGDDSSRRQALLHRYCSVIGFVMCFVVISLLTIAFIVVVDDISQSQMIMHTVLRPLRRNMDRNIVY